MKNARCICPIVLVISVVIVSLGALSGTIRSAYLRTINRAVSSLYPPEVAFIGTSLTSNCPWRWGSRRFSIINLSISGSEILEVRRQLIEALSLKPRVISIEGGINDVIMENVSIEQIKSDFERMLNALPRDQAAIVTLIPYVSSPTASPRIQDVNITLRKLSEARGLKIIDLNGEISLFGRRARGMTYDGIHFTEAVCVIWARDVERALTTF